MTEGGGAVTDMLARARDVAAQIDRGFDRLLAVPDDARARLYEAMRHAAIGGGKRLRPLLVQAACDLFHISRESALRVGLAIDPIFARSKRASLLRRPQVIPISRWARRNLLAAPPMKKQARTGRRTDD